MNNFTKAKRLIIFKREHKKRHDKEDFEESKRINSKYYVTQNSNFSASSADDKLRNSAIKPNNISNELKTKNNLAGTNKSFKTSITFNKIDSIKEVPEEDVNIIIDIYIINNWGIK